MCYQRCSKPIWINEKWGKMMRSIGSKSQFTTKISQRPRFLPLVASSIIRFAIRGGSTPFFLSLLSIFSSIQFPSYSLYLQNIEAWLHSQLREGVSQTHIRKECLSASNFPMKSKKILLHVDFKGSGSDRLREVSKLSGGSKVEYCELFDFLPNW